MDFSAFCRGLVVFTSLFVFQCGGALYTHYSHYKHIIECRKSPHPGNCAVGDFGCEISAKKGGMDCGLMNSKLGSFRRVVTPF